MEWKTTVFRCDPVGLPHIENYMPVIGRIDIERRVNSPSSVVVGWDEKVDPDRRTRGTEVSTSVSIGRRIWSHWFDPALRDQCLSSAFNACVTQE